MQVLFLFLQLSSIFAPNDYEYVMKLCIIYVLEHKCPGACIKGLLSRQVCPYLLYLGSDSIG